MVKALEPYSNTAEQSSKSGGSGDGAGAGTKKDDRMFVVKRDGRKEAVHFDKITSRIRKLSYGLNMDYIDPPAITFKVKDDPCFLSPFPWLIMELFFSPL